MSSANPARPSKGRYTLNKTKYLNDPEFDILESTLQRHMERDARNCVLLVLALQTGARAQELLNLRFDDLNSHDKTVFIRGLKGSNDRELPVRDTLFWALERLKRPNKARDPRWQIKTDGQLVFPLSYQRLRQIWLFYRPTDKKFHCLRHTFAIRLYKKTKDIRLVQVALGHRSIANTMVYADYIYSQQELRRLVL